MGRPHRPDASASLTTLPTTAPSIDVPMQVTYHKEPLHRLASSIPLQQHRGVDVVNTFGDLVARGIIHPAPVE
jgi:hypothetical protein